MTKEEDIFEYWIQEASKGRNMAECWQNCYRIQNKMLKDFLTEILPEGIGGGCDDELVSKNEIQSNAEKILEGLK